MFIRLSLAATLLLLANLAVAADVTPPTDDAARANALSQQLGDEAGPIAADVSRESGWTVGRTALRVRNPANAPDAWERQILEGFAMAAEDGANVAGLSFQETTGSGEAQRWRYMKAIPTGPMCTACHGSNIDPALEEAIRASYPEDQATGFAPGSLRGAFTMSHPTL